MLTWVNRSLIFSLIRNAIQSRYRTSWLGLLWPILQPLLLIGVFSLVFGYIMPLRWSAAADQAISFPIFLYSGLVLFTFFAEVINQAPSLVLAKVNLVKKVVFPLEVLSIVSVMTALVFFSINFLVFLVFAAFSGVQLSFSVVLLPLQIIPFVLFLIGASWFLSGLSVYLRDVLHVVGLVVSAMLFLSPVFYPLSSAPELVQQIMALNPMATMIQSIRGDVFQMDAPSGLAIALLWFGGAAMFYLGYLWFARVKRGFADVL